LEEALNKPNIRSAIERFIINNSTNNIVNSGNIDKVTFCHNLSNNPKIENSDIPETKKSVIKAKLETVPKLIQLRLTVEQIAQALGLDIQLILDSLKQE
jgi:hypothetical protein